MIHQHIHGARCGPIIRCEACGKAIRDARQGTVLWEGGKLNAEPLFLHCGQCCRRYEAAHPDTAFDSLPLSVWLVFLANGCRLKWLKAGKLAAMIGEVG
jgi:hypothetical protein